MVSLKELNTNDLEILCDNAGLDMATTNLLIAKFIKFVPFSTVDREEWIYQVVASEDGDNNICICELSVTIDRNGDFSADFAGTPLFESNDMSAITEVWNEGPAVQLDDDFNPIPETEFLSLRGVVDSDSDEVKNLINAGR